MPTTKIYNQSGQAAGDIKLAEKIFGVKTNEALLHQAVVTQMANQRQVLAHTKDRSEVSGGGKKPWRQKGTGRARVGSNRSPIWIGGGVTFGPLKTRNFSKDINKKMKRKALYMAISDKLANGNFIALENLEMEEFKTKKMNDVVNNLENVLRKEEKGKRIKRSVLIIDEKLDSKSRFSGRNLEGVKIINLDNINVVDVLNFRDLFLTVESIKKLEKTIN